ncbi:hypothetical protein EUX98_g6520 [Antrodiella citrinella]|uniref:Elongation factor Ts, mitochondrial n=1 Tax=Antrodiella citrinella TaxID=2447956 RepID=A0A4S4MQV7_9APHY|nr:hypothetical protein EUX98_g6520 [Antrodiella citrinella]
MTRPFPRSLLPSLRHYSTPSSTVPIKLIAKLRKQSPVSLSLARTALEASSLSVSGALEWLAANAATSNAKKVDKVGGRSTNEGMVGVYTISHGVTGRMRAPVWAGMVEMNSETDFVARGELFGKLLSEIAHSAAFNAASKERVKKDQNKSADDGGLMKPVDVNELLNAPLISFSNTDVSGKPLPTISDAIRTLMGQVGENISLRRAATVKRDLFQIKNVGLRLASYGHGGTFSIPASFQSGRVASMAVLALKGQFTGDTSICGLVRQQPGFINDLEELEAALVRQISGFPTTAIDGQSLLEGEEAEAALYNQQFMMYPPASDASVREVLEKWAQQHDLVETKENEGGLQVVEFLKWTVGGESVAGRL